MPFWTAILPLVAGGSVLFLAGVAAGIIISERTLDSAIVNVFNRYGVKVREME